MNRRIEAGATPPQNPREQHSRITATFLQTYFPRTYRFTHQLFHPSSYTIGEPARRQFSELGASAPERFRRSYASVIELTQKELSSTEFTLPKNRPVGGNTNEELYVAIASGNSIKTDEMKNLLSPHPVTVVRVEEADEIHSLNTVTDALSKAYDAARIIQESTQTSRREIRNHEYVTLANDVLNAVPVLKMNEQTGLREVVFERKGKPKTLTHEDGTPLTVSEQLQSIRQTFADMVDLAEANHWAYIPYLTESASVIHNPKDPTNNAISTQRSAIFMTVEGVRYLATPEGFADYLYRIEDRGHDIRSIAGGLEFRTMKEMGLFQYITGTAEDISTEGFAQQRENAEQHASKIALGHADERLIAAYFGSQEPTEDL